MKKRGQIIEEHFDTVATINETPLRSGNSSVSTYIGDNHLFEVLVEQHVHGEARVGTSRPLGNVLNKKTPLPLKIEFVIACELCTACLRNVFLELKSFEPESQH